MTPANSIPSFSRGLNRFHERLSKVQAALGGTLELRKLTAGETFHDRILRVTGRRWPPLKVSGPHPRPRWRTGAKHVRHQKGEGDL
jgi:hypothetical protein